MAYATGSGSTLADLLDALRTFALSEGWTIVKWTSGVPYLALSKGNCFAAWQGFTNTTITSYASGSSDSIPDYCLRGTLANSLNSALDVYYGHPGSTATTATDSDAVLVNDLNGPYVAWHFFSGDEVGGDPAYIHCVVQTASDRFQHFSFGNLDKRGMTHNGVAYMHGQYSLWTQDASVLNTSSSNFNDPSEQEIAFGNSSQHYYVLSNVHPVSWGADNLHVSVNVSDPKFLYSINPSRSPLAFPGSNTSGALLDGVVHAEALSFSNVVPMFAIPAMFYFVGTSPDQVLYVGDHPNVRLLNLTGMAAGQEINISGDTWKIFPTIRQVAWGLDWTTAYNGCTSGQYGLAYKKIT